MLVIKCLNYATETPLQSPQLSQSIPDYIIIIKQITNDIIYILDLFNNNTYGIIYASRLIIILFHSQYYINIYTFMKLKYCIG